MRIERDKARQRLDARVHVIRRELDPRPARLVRDRNPVDPAERTAHEGDTGLEERPVVFVALQQMIGDGAQKLFPRIRCDLWVEGGIDQGILRQRCELLES